MKKESHKDRKRHNIIERDRLTDSERKKNEREMERQKKKANNYHFRQRKKIHNFNCKA